MATPETIELTFRQQRFVQEYLVDLNATQAAIRAGYSAQTAAQIGAENLIKPQISNFIKQALLAQGERVEAKTDDIILELKRVAYQDIRDMGTWDDQGRMTIKASSELTADQTRAIRRIRAITKTRREKDGSEYTTHELIVVLHDKVMALALLGKHRGIFPTTWQKNGQLTDHSEEARSIDLSQLTPEELEELKRLRNKMKRTNGNGTDPEPLTIEASATKADEVVGEV